MQGRARGSWRAIWIVRNSGSRPVRIERAWHPHGRFRSTRRRVPVAVAAGHFATFALPVRTDVGDRETVENAFLIVEVSAEGERWRILARLRLRGRAGVPKVTVEAIDTHPATA